ncbi:MAG TPA: 4-hydroxyphenylacetate 3-hydroxylase N-terminal domain-containing protein [Dehalococcoidia bacterium]|nr:4-hydroxyphenylacetate 3-hydroxylase N-terminal domain-containing protein [Dehalococcoidia bacterium]
MTAQPADATTQTTTRPMTGAEYLESLRDGREIWLYGERVKDVTTHPAFRNTARMIARLYDALHDPKHKDVLTTQTDTGSGGYTQRFFKAPMSWEEQVAGRDAIAAWARLTYGWLGRAPDYKGAFLGTLGANAAFYKPYEANARAWYKKAQEHVLYLNHAIIHPPVDRDRAIHERAEVCVHAVKETDAGIVVSGAKVVATGSALTNATFVAHNGLIPVQDRQYACIFMVPMDAPGVKLISRASYENTAAVMGTPFDYPLSSRLDENDAIFVLDNVLIPWEDVFCFGDIDAANNFFPQTGFLPRALLHGCTRLAVKLEFIAGLMMQAFEATGHKDYRGQQVRLGEVIAYRNLFWSLSDAMARNATPWVNGAVLPNIEAATAYHVFGATFYPIVKNLIEQSVASGLIYLNSSARDFHNPELRPYIDKYIRGSDGYDAEKRVKLMKLLWDAIGTEFGARHELYEINYSGSTEENRLTALNIANAIGLTDRAKAMVNACMADYDINGWTAPDLINPDDVSWLPKR